MIITRNPDLYRPDYMTFVHIHNYIASITKPHSILAWFASVRASSPRTVKQAAERNPTVVVVRMSIVHCKVVQR